MDQRECHLEPGVIKSSRCAGTPLRDSDAYLPSLLSRSWTRTSIVPRLSSPAAPSYSQLVRIVHIISASLVHSLDSLVLTRILHQFAPWLLVTIRRSRTSMAWPSTSRRRRRPTLSSTDGRRWRCVRPSRCGACTIRLRGGGKRTALGATPGSPSGMSFSFFLSCVHRRARAGF